MKNQYQETKMTSYFTEKKIFKYMRSDSCSEIYIKIVVNQFLKIKGLKLKVGEDVGSEFPPMV